MFGVDSGELFIIVLIAVVVIGPKELPRVMRTVGSWVGRARGMANQFRAGVDQMVRDSEIADLEKKWREQNEAIMRAHPASPAVSDWGLPPPPPSVPNPADDKPVAPPSGTIAGDVHPAGKPPAAPEPIAPSYPAPRTSTRSDQR